MTWLNLMSPPQLSVRPDTWCGSRHLAEVVISIGALADVAKAFMRKVKAHGYGDSDEAGTVIPPALRKMSEQYNGGQEDQDKTLDKLRTDDGTVAG